jgi:hypothetical protein
VGLVDELGAQRNRQVVVLIPVVIPDRWRYRLLHTQVDLALASELRRRPDVVVARGPLPIHVSSPAITDGRPYDAGTPET